MSFVKMQGAVAHLMPKILAHPFHKALQNGTLPLPVFRCFLNHDAQYLQNFSSALLITSKRFADQKHARQFKEFSEELIDTEKNLHFKYLGDTTRVTSFPACAKTAQIVQNYSDHLIHSAKEGPLEVAVASFIPCFWIYSELGQLIRPRSLDNRNHFYQLWLASYSNAQFTAATQSLIHISNEHAKKVTCPRLQTKIIGAFVVSVEHELKFWDSVYPKTA